MQLSDAPKRNGKVVGASVRMDLPIMGREELETGETPEPMASTRADGSEPAAEEEEGVTHGV